MTKQEFIARLTRDPIVVEQIAKLSHYRIALHDDPDARGGVWIDLSRVAGTLFVDDYEQVYARVDGKIVHLTHRDVDAVVSRLRQLFMLGAIPRDRRARTRSRNRGQEDRAPGGSSGGRT
ncbi:MAG TPA: hypothetical protein VGF28_26080 [Thermoanaerobaculia bacterium]|jgi:hypothetical protein